jgi:putative tryptophan/tyrosine transport system substrate-binding protein
MKRREFITLIGGAAVTWPFAARAQQPGKRPLIVCLIGGSKASTERFFGGFSQGMRELGYVEGRDYGFEVRYAEAISLASRSRRKSWSASSPTSSCRARWLA